MDCKELEKTLKKIENEVNLLREEILFWRGFAIYKIKKMNPKAAFWLKLKFERMDRRRKRKCQ